MFVCGTKILPPALVLSLSARSITKWKSFIPVACHSFPAFSLSLAGTDSEYRNRQRAVSGDSFIREMKRG